MSSTSAHAQGEYAAHLRELVVVADDDADLAGADVEHADLAAALVELHLVARQVQLPLLADVAVRPDKHLSVVGDVAFLFAHPDAEDLAIVFCQGAQPPNRGAVGHRLGQIPGVGSAVAVDDQLGEEDQFRSLGGGSLAPAGDGSEDALRLTEETVHAHRGRRALSAWSLSPRPGRQGEGPILP